MGLSEQIQQDMKDALKAGEKVRLETLRMLRSQLRNAEITSGDALSEEDIVGVLTKEAKRRKESLEMYEKGGREDLAENERSELRIIESYLPEALSNDVLVGIIDEVIESTGADTMNDFGKVMGPVMQRVKGQADGKAVQELVRKKLS